MGALIQLDVGYKQGINVFGNILLADHCCVSKHKHTHTKLTEN